MSSEKFEIFVDDFRNLSESLSVKLKKAASSFGEPKKSLLKEVERGLEEAEETLRAMEDEARRAPASYRSAMLATVQKNYRDIDTIRKELRKYGSAFSAAGDREELLGGFGDNDELRQMEQGQRSKLMEGHSSLQRTGESLMRSHQISAETDQIGTVIVSDLGTQREQLERTRDRLVDTDSQLSQSRRILNTMGRRIITSKLVLVIIILLELGILGGLTYWKFFS